MCSEGAIVSFLGDEDEVSSKEASEVRDASTASSGEDFSLSHVASMPVLRQLHKPEEQKARVLEREHMQIATARDAREVSPLVGSRSALHSPLAACTIRGFPDVQKDAGHSRTPPTAKSVRHLDQNRLRLSIEDSILSASKLKNFHTDCDPARLTEVLEIPRINCQAVSDSSDEDLETQQHIEDKYLRKKG